jgi:hypothetical protein
MRIDWCITCIGSVHLLREVRDKIITFKVFLRFFNILTFLWIVEFIFIVVDVNTH